MLSFNFTFTPFDMSACYEQYEHEYSWGWIDKQDLQRDVVQGLIPKDEYKKITGEDYEAPKTTAN